ncbi:MAG TPA: YdjY domain-containing protein [Planctomycetota bacterium]
MRALHVLSSLALVLVTQDALRLQDPPKAQDPGKPQQAADPKQVLDEVLAQFKKEGIELDPKAQTVTVAATANEPQNEIEYLLIHRRGKRHEALFVTRSKPSVLNAALLMLGLQPGQNAQAIEKQPPPSIEEIEKGADPLVIVPPKGMQLWMTVRWKTPEEKQDKWEEYCVEDIVMDLTTQEPVVDCSWVYLGGRLARFYKDEPEVYAADMEGNLVSTCYMSPDNHLATMVHKDARDQQNWWFTNKMPKHDTPVQFVFHRIEPELHKARAKRLKAAQEQAGRKDEKKGDEPGGGGR